MHFLEKNNDQRTRPTGSGDGSPASDELLEQIRSQAERMLTAGDEAIRRALSGDSQAFLRSSRQDGGQ